MFSSDDTMDREDTMDNCQHLAEDMNLDTEADWAQILDNQPIVLNDRMMTDAVQSPHIQSEHSYSLTLNDEMPQSPFGHNIKLEDYSKDSRCYLFWRNPGRLSLFLRNRSSYSSSKERDEKHSRWNVSQFLE
ncbi:unnamed protein product [Larinioides sclopetarius]|uniref:Uncharacterized protein n=1 Tax=Larinioides sclopetarius TaxID=280406 RepID=A0AAV2AI42_9ARAC